MIEFTRDWELDYESCGCVDVAVVSNFGLVGRHVVARWAGSFCRWLIWLRRFIDMTLTRPIRGHGRWNHQGTHGSTTCIAHLMEISIGLAILLTMRL
jgi:hypothetical protein